MTAIPNVLEKQLLPANLLLFNNTGILGPQMCPTLKTNIELRFFKPFASDVDFIYRGVCILLPTITFSLLTLESLLLGIGYFVKSLAYDLPRLNFQDLVQSLAYVAMTTVVAFSFAILALVSPLANFIDWMGTGILQTFFPENDAELSLQETDISYNIMN
jgi:hypothetical protein